MRVVRLLCAIFMLSALLAWVPHEVSALPAYETYGEKMRVDWNTRCAQRCRTARHKIRVYLPDNTARTFYMAIYSINPPAGCLCRPPKK